MSLHDLWKRLDCLSRKREYPLDFMESLIMSFPYDVVSMNTDEQRKKYTES